MTGCIRDSWRFMQIIEELLRSGHLVRFRADGWSMHPTIRNGEIITVAPLGHAAVRAGDIVLYRRDRAAIAHRVIEIQSSSGGPLELVLRGDAAAFCDRPIGPEQVLGRVQAVERSGRTVRLGLLRRSWIRALARAIRRHLAARTPLAVVIRRSE